ncbi:alpha/beta hydrolase family protein [Croceivirga thetidis]|uniref:Alpha/beta hydrolase n=1 Tax=Croceivirga thetidis TaxID=2721623 RepID=A0ABX1GU40_9FLAO|nr:alpha/beta hydrolase [Croceivirga thetidis]NKI33448.1 alpha/beta hydrolase [Croceivirga thetidis]
MKNLFLLFFYGFFGLIHGQQLIVESISLTNNEIQLPGELTLPKTAKKTPLVIFVHGSGNVDRNGNQEPVIKANYIKLLADSLNKKSIAFYRFDKRTSVKENRSKLGYIQFEDFVSDVKQVIEHFKKDDRFSGIHLIGHSQGSLVAMLASDSNVKSFVSLAGPGESIQKSIVRQISAQNTELGKAAKLHMDELMETDTIQNVSPLLFQIFAPQNQKFLKSWMAYDPAEEIKSLKKPVLIVQGEMDSQISLHDANLLMSACSKINSGFGAPASLLKIPDMNHILKSVSNEIENQASYYDPSFELSSKLIDGLTNFIHSNG